MKVTNEICKELLELEKKYNLFDLKIDGIPYWQLIRCAVFTDYFFSDSFICENRGPERKKIKYFVDLFLHKFFVKKNQCRIKPCDVIVINKFDYKNFKGELFEWICDSVKYPENISVQHIYQFHYPKYHRYDIIDCSDIEFDMFWGRVRRVLFRNIKIADEHREIFAEFFSEANKIVNKNSSIEKYIYQINVSIFYQKMYQKQWERILKKATPKIVILQNSYGATEFGVIAAAHELGITVVELQHGKTDYHPAYIYGDLTERGKILPDYFFTWGDFWSENVRMPSSMKVVSVGYPFLESQIASYPDVADEKTIAVFSATGKEARELAAFVFNCMNDLQWKGYKVLYKFHPTDTDYVKDIELFKDYSNISFYYADTSQYEIISRARSVVSYMSTVSYEATIYSGRKNIVYCHDEDSAVDALLNTGLALKVTTKEEFLRIIENDFDIGQINNCEFMWTRNSESNFIEEIRKIVG